MWVKYYGDARDTAKRRPRLDKGKPKNQTSLQGKLKLSKWVKRRREEVNELVATKRPRVSLTKEAPAEVVGEGGWTQDHQKERDFQDCKRMVRFMEAMDQEYTIAKEHTAGTQEALRLWRQYEKDQLARYTSTKRER